MRGGKKGRGGRGEVRRWGWPKTTQAKYPNERVDKVGRQKSPVRSALPSPGSVSVPFVFFFLLAKGAECNGFSPFLRLGKHWDGVEFSFVNLEISLFCFILF